MKNKEKIIGSVAIICISIIFIIAGYVMSNSKEEFNSTDYKDIFVETEKISVKKNAEDINAVSPNSVESGKVKVDIKGAVKKPGVYEIENGSRIVDLIEVAGGVTPEADLSSTNLSIKLQDQNCVVIPKKGDLEGNQNFQGNITNFTIASSESKTSIINLNTANREELKTLVGIGDAKADAIIKYREQNGGFRSVEELTKVDGIGEKTLSKFVDKVDIK